MTYGWMPVGPVAVVSQEESVQARAWSLDLQGKYQLKGLAQSKAASDIKGDVGIEKRGHVMTDHRLTGPLEGVEENLNTVSLNKYYNARKKWILLLDYYYIT